MLGYTQSYIGNKIIRPKIVEKQVTCFTIQEQEKILISTVLFLVQ